jgi:hypothetical protein
MKKFIDFLLVIIFFTIILLRAYVFTNLTKTQDAMIYFVESALIYYIFHIPLSKEKEMVKKENDLRSKKSSYFRCVLALLVVICFYYCIFNYAKI